MPIRFRQATLGDIEPLIELIAAYYAHDQLPFDEARVRRGLAELITHPGFGGAWLILHGGQLAGHFLLTYGFDLEFGGRQATITELYIRPEHRRKGLGRAALDQVALILRGLRIGAFELQVEAGNASALAFYESVGMRRFDRIPMSKDVRAPAVEGVRAAAPPSGRPVGLVQSYDRVAEAYAAALNHELDGKPFDRALLRGLIDEAAGPILEVGGGPGQVARFLADHGADVRGSDLSPGMVSLARRLHPHIEFEVADFRAMPHPPGSMAGVVAFYAIVHTRPEELGDVFQALHNVLQPGGLLLLGFHLGHENVHSDHLFGEPVDLYFQFHQMNIVQNALIQCGFEIRLAAERAPYVGAEHPSQRGYVLARRG